MWMSFYLGTFFAIVHLSKSDTIVVRGQTDEDMECLLNNMSPEDRELCSVSVRGKTDEDIERLLDSMSPEDRNFYFKMTEKDRDNDSIRWMEMPRHVFTRNFVDKEEEDVDFIKCDCMYLEDDDTSEADINETES